MESRYFTTPRYQVGILGRAPQVNPFNPILAQYLRDYDRLEAEFQHPLRQERFERYRPTSRPEPTATPTVTPTPTPTPTLTPTDQGGGDAGGGPGGTAAPGGNPGTPSSAPSVGGFGLGTPEGMVGGMIGSLAGPVGGIAGSAIGNSIAGQTPANVASQSFGSLAGMAIAGPIGGLIGGMVGGHVGGRAENAQTGFGRAGIGLGFTDALGAGLGFGDYSGGMGGYGVSTPAEAANPGVAGVPGGMAAPPSGNPAATASYAGDAGNSGGNTSAQGDSPADPGSPAGGAAAASGGHGDTPGVGDNAGDAGAGAGDGGSVICTALHDLGRLERPTWEAAESFGRAFLRSDPAVIRGYHKWGKPIARFIRKHPLAARIAKLVFAPAFREMAFRQGKTPHGSVVGKIIVNTGTILSRFLGRKPK